MEMAQPMADKSGLCSQRSAGNWLKPKGVFCAVQLTCEGTVQSLELGDSTVALLQIRK